MSYSEQLLPASNSNVWTCQDLWTGCWLWSLSVDLYGWCSLCLRGFFRAVRYKSALGNHWIHWLNNVKSLYPSLELCLVWWLPSWSGFLSAAQEMNNDSLKFPILKLKTEKNTARPPSLPFPTAISHLLWAGALPMRNVYSSQRMLNPHVTTQGLCLSWRLSWPQSLEELTLWTRVLYQRGGRARAHHRRHVPRAKWTE